MIKYYFSFFLFIACHTKDSYDLPIHSHFGPPPEVNTNIRAVQEAVLQSETGYLLLDSDTELWLEGYVLSTDKTGNFYKELFIQDDWKEPQRALRIVMDHQALYTVFPLGRKVYVQLNGLGAGYQNGILSLGRYRADGIDLLPETLIAKHLIRDTLERSLRPYPLSIADFHTNHIGKYITLNAVQFASDETHKTFAGEAFDRYDGERRLEQCVDYRSTWLLTSTYSGFKSHIVPQEQGFLNGVLTRNYYDDQYVIKINSPANISQTDSRCDPPYMEAFETFLLGKITAQDWTNWSEKGTQSWEVFRDENTLGQSARMGSYRSGDKATLSWLITPLLDLSSLQHPQLSFRTSVAFADNSQLDVFVSTDWDGSTANLRNSRWESLPARLAHKGDAPEDWIDSGAVALPAARFVHLAFVYNGSGKTSQDGTFELDDIRIIDKNE